MVFLGLSVLDLGPMYATDRQTDRQTDRRQTKVSLNVSARGGGITMVKLHSTLRCDTYDVYLVLKFAFLTHVLRN